MRDLLLLQVRALGLLLLGGLMSVPSLAQLPTVRIGIVVDGPSQHNDVLQQLYQQEITVILEGEYEVQFPVGKNLQGSWSAASVKEALDRLLADSEVDLVLALGVLSSSEAARRPRLPKTVFAPFVIHPQVQGIPLSIRERPLPPPEGVERIPVSGVANLSYLTAGVDFVREVSQFRDIVPFSRLTVLRMQAWEEVVPDVDKNILKALASLGLERIDTVAVGTSLEAALQAIPSDSEAVYVTPLPQLSSDDFQRLAQALVDRRLPSFSLSGRGEVKLGLLAALGPQDSNRRRARRVAIQLQEVLSGRQAEEQSVEFLRAERLSINLATARAIGVSPRSALLIEADLLHEERTRAARTLSLSSVIREASTVNLDLAAADRRVAAGLGLVREARSGLLPQLQASGGATFLDGDRAEALPTLAQRQYNLSVTASQLIYSDQVLANYQIERNLQSLREEERSQLRLDVILEGAESYLNVLRAQTIERIQKDNLELTRTNLNLSRSRVDIGVAGREEVFRWESQIATNQRDVVDAQALRAQAEIAVNRVLNRPLDEGFLTVEATLGDPELVSSFEGIGPYIESPAAFDVFSDFMAQEAFGASPELRQLDASVRAQERAVSTARRDFFIPDVALFADVTGVENDGRGAVEIPGFNAWDWTVRVDASLPIFQGGALRARLYRTRQELQELQLRRDAARQRVDQRVRSILQDAGASYIGIELSRRAAEAARRNLELVSDRYGEGVVGILVLLDAQNQALVAELAAANAVFDYLIDLMGVQRAAGRFDYYRSPQQRQDYLNRVQAFFDQVGFRVRRP